MTTDMKPGDYEIRKPDGKLLDEVVAYKPKFVHLEQMDDGHWWLGIDLPNGRRILVNFTSRGKIKATAELD